MVFTLVSEQPQSCLVYRLSGQVSLQALLDLADSLEQALHVALVDQRQAAFSRLVGRALRVGDVALGLDANTDQRRAE